MSRHNDYHKSEGINRSHLFYLSKSPEYFKFMLDNPPEPTNDLIIGSAFHKLVLEPDTYDSEFLTAPNVDRRTKEGKAAYAEFEQRLSDEISAISQADFELISAMRDSVMNNELAKTVLSGIIESPVYWTDKLTGERCKCKPDVRTEISDHPVIVDLKSCRSAETEIFMRDCFRYGYDLEAAMYKEGCDTAFGVKHEFVFVCVEKIPPYSVNVLQADDFFIERGQFLFRKYMSIYHDCKISGNWYGYGGKENMINNLSVPAWMISDIG